MAARLQVARRGGVQQVRPERAAAAIRAEQPLRLPQRAEQGVAGDDLGDRRRGAAAAERRAMRQGVVADPVAFRPGAVGQRQAGGVAQLVADQEEGRRDAAAGQGGEDAGGDLGLRPVVEGEAEGLHGGRLHALPMASMGPVDGEFIVVQTRSIPVLFASKMLSPVRPQFR